MQNVLGNSPLQAGLKLLVWTGATMVVAPFAGVFSARFGSRSFMVTGLSLQAGALAWFASMASTHLPYSHMLVPFVMAGAGMALVFAPAANAVLSSVRNSRLRRCAISWQRNGRVFRTTFSGGAQSSA